MLTAFEDNADMTIRPASDSMSAIADDDSRVHEFDLDDIEDGLSLAPPSEPHAGNASIANTFETAMKGSLSGEQPKYDMAPANDADKPEKAVREHDALYGDNPFLTQPTVPAASDIRQPVGNGAGDETPNRKPAVDGQAASNQNILPPNMPAYADNASRRTAWAEYMASQQKAFEARLDMPDAPEPRPSDVPAMRALSASSPKPAEAVPLTIPQPVRRAQETVRREKPSNPNDMDAGDDNAGIADMPSCQQPQAVQSPSPQGNHDDTGIGMAWDGDMDETGTPDDGEQQFELAVDTANEDVGYEWQNGGRHGMSRKAKAYAKMATVIVLTVVVVLGAMFLFGRKMPDYDGFNRQQAIEQQERNNDDNGKQLQPERQEGQQ